MTAHSILGVPHDATKEQIKQAYRKKAFQFHPDKNPSPSAHQKFIEITEAYEELIDEKRSKSKNTYEPHFTYEDILEKRRSDFHERAEYYANLKYEEFKKEADAFKRVKYYWAVVTLVSAYFSITGIIGIICCLLPIILTVMFGWYGLFGIFFLAIGLLILRDIYQSYLQLKPYLREKGYVRNEDETDEDKPAKEVKKPTFNDFINSISALKIPKFYFKEFKLYKLLLLFPMFFALIYLVDWVLPAKKNIETLSSIDVYRNSRYSITEYITDNFRFQPGENFAGYGDLLLIYSTPVLKTVLSAGVYDPATKKTTILYSPRQTVYTGYYAMLFIIPIMGLIGWVTIHKEIVSAMLVLSVGQCILIYYFS
ncbi:MAG: DnaJ domain-containing protein [Bacteroidia bacterium]